MNLLFIYDSPELREIGKICNNISFKKQIHISTIDDTSHKRLLYDVAIEIKKKINDNEHAVIFVDQYLSCADEDFEWLEKNAGIALIKFLRMMGVHHHIVLISPFTEAELLRQNPENYIVSSKGVSLKKYLDEISEWPLSSFNYLSADKFSGLLKPYLSIDFELPEDNRHDWANWWGIDRLWNIHRVVEKEKYGFTERWNLKEYPDSLKDKIKQLKNSKALFLYAHRDKIIANRLIQFNEEIESLKKTLQTYISARDNYIKEKELIKSLLRDKNYEIRNLEKRISYIEFRLPGLNGLSSFFYEIKSECIKKIVQLSDQIRDFEIRLMEEYGLNENIRGLNCRITNVDEELMEFKNLLIQEEERYLNILKFQIDVLDEEINRQQSRISSLSLYTIRKQLQEKSPKIIYIDDQADEGWSNIFQQIVYNKEEENLFKVIQSEMEVNIDTDYFYATVSPLIEKHNPDLILLDLRLHKESGIRLEVENLTGAILLKEIKRHYPGLPVLMTTASNKSWSYEELLRIGCDAFWTKEGVDTGMTELDSIRNYLRFAELCLVLIGDDYCCLKEYFENVKRLEEKGKNQKHWWQQEDRFKKDRLNEVEPDIIYSILKDTAIIFREYLKSKIIRQSDLTIFNGWFYASLIIQNLGKIIEKLHYSGAEVSIVIMNYREDFCGKQLFLKRHEASHIELTKKLTEGDAKNFMNEILEYLNNKEYCPKPGPKVVGQTKL